MCCGAKIERGRLGLRDASGESPCFYCILLSLATLLILDHVWLMAPDRV